MAVEARLVISMRGGKLTANQIDNIRKRVEATRADVQKFKKSGGLAAIAVGTDKINAAEKEIEQLGSALISTEIKAAELQQSLLALDPKAEDFDEEFDKLNKSIINVEASSASLEKQLAMLGRGLREEVMESVGFIGDIDSSLKAIGGAAGAFGRQAGGPVGDLLVGIDEAALLAGELFAVAEALPRLSGAMGILKGHVISVVPAIATQSLAQGQLSTSAVAATVSLTGMSTASASVAVAAVATSLALGAIVAVGALLVIGSKKRTKAIKDEITAQRIQLNQSIAFNAAIRSLSTEEATSQIADLSRELEIQKIARDELIKTLVAGSGEIDGAGERLFAGLEVAAAHLGISIGTIKEAEEALKLYNDTIGKQTDDLETLQKVLDALDQVEASRNIASGILERQELEIEAAELIKNATSEQLDERLSQIEVERTAIAKSKAVADANIVSFEKENKTRIASLEAIVKSGGEGALAAADQLSILQAQLEPFAEVSKEAASELAILNAEEQNIVDNARPLVVVRQAEEKAIADQTAAMKALFTVREQAVTSLESINKQISDIANVEKIKAARTAEENALKSEFATLEASLKKRLQAAKAGEVLAAAESKISGIREKAQSDAAKSQTKLSEDLAKINADRQKAAKDHAKAIAEIESDSNTTIKDAIAKRDVATVKATQISRDKQLAAVSEQQSEEEKLFGERATELQRQFKVESQQRKRASEVAIQQAKEEARTKIASALGVATAVKKIEQQLAQARIKLAADLANVAARFQQQAAQNRLKALQNQQQALQTQIASLDRNVAISLANMVRNAAGAIVSTFGSGLSSLQSVINATNAAATVSASIKNLTGSFRNIVPFAEGGLVTRPTLALVGESGPEFIIPASRAGQPGLGGSTTQINAPITIGNIGENVTQAELNDVKGAIISAFQQATRTA